MASWGAWAKRRPPRSAGIAGGYDGGVEDGGVEDEGGAGGAGRRRAGRDGAERREEGMSESEGEDVIGTYFEFGRVFSHFGFGLSAIRLYWNSR